ncbi:MAG: 30S ribosomal protein S5, partial [Erythrobacter sp.]
MVEENKNQNGESDAVNSLPQVPETQEAVAAKANADVPAIAKTPSEAADNQNPAQEPSAQPTEQPKRSRG